MRKLTPVESILNRMYNWKLESAYRQAEGVPGFPKEALAQLKALSEAFGNCGWQEGRAFDALRDGNNAVALKLGYVWNDAKDYWVPLEKPASPSPEI
jgi:hypothetical protein